MRQLTLLITLLSIILIGCGSGSQRSTEVNGITVINLSGRLPYKEIHLRDVADIEYIALETTDDVLLGQVSIISHVSDRYIVLWDFNGNVFIFDRAGKIVSHFNHRGQGPREYAFMTGVGAVFDEKNEEVFVFNTFANRILVYSITGEYRRTLHIDADLDISASSSAFSFDNETLLIYDNLPRSLDGYGHNKRPFMLLSKKDGSIVYVLDISLPARYQTTVPHRVEVDGQTFYTTLAIGFENNKRFGSDFVIANISSDTIYKFTQNRELTPWLVRTPSVHLSEPRAIWAHLLTTDRFTIIQETTLDFTAAAQRQRVPSATLIYEFETGQVSNISFVNDDFPTRAWRLSYTDKNTAVSLIQAADLIVAYEDNLLKGELKEFVTTIDEEDNPVVMIVRFR